MITGVLGVASSEGRVHNSGGRGWFGVSDRGRSIEQPGGAACADDREVRELSRMLSELNEVRMRLDAVVRKLAASTWVSAETRDSLGDIEALRLRLNSQLDRLRYKLVSQMPEQT